MIKKEKRNLTMNENEDIDLKLKGSKDLISWIKQQVDVSASIRAAVFEFVKKMVMVMQSEH